MPMERQRIGRRTNTGQLVVEQTRKLKETARLIADRCRQANQPEIAAQVEDAMCRIGNAAMVIVAAAEVLRDIN